MPDPSNEARKVVDWGKRSTREGKHERGDVAGDTVQGARGECGEEESDVPRQRSALLAAIISTPINGHANVGVGRQDLIDRAWAP